uniref:TadE/TadG family type IV pilus assembly protein n=1 Tax=Parerythrobacter lutipelagi TaxID=1964208 RepID=UPI0013763658|nr:TadE family protein [Parerythrobacter lutipelagi]
MSNQRSIFRDQDGAAIVEFALIAPTFLMLMFGLCELGHTMYVQSIVNGAIQEAARDSTMESARHNQIEANVRQTIRTVAPMATVTFNRKNHMEYMNINRLELFTDLNNDGICNDGEPFEDLNESGTHDHANGKDGQGKAGEVVIFQVAVTYDRLFPMPNLSGWSKQNEVVGTTLLRNQPYRERDRRIVIRNCR